MLPTRSEDKEAKATLAEMPVNKRYASGNAYAIPVKAALSWARKR